MILTGGPTLRSVGRLAGVRIPAGAARHTVAVLEPDPVFAVERMPMVFDIGAGLYWRLEEGGLLFGWSNPDEAPGEARAIDWTFYDLMRSRLGGLVPAPATSGSGGSGRPPSTSRPTTCRSSGRRSTPRAGRSAGVTVASAGGHGMMWGPGVARVAADLAVHGATTLIDAAELGLDRFDAEGRSRLAADPIALPFPTSTAGPDGSSGPT